MTPERAAASAGDALCVVHGIPNCDQVKKARAWLDGRGIAYRFHDFKRDGLARDLALEWVRELGWEALLNRKGTTWRKLAEAERPDNETTAIALMLAQSSVIKRPVLARGKALLVGFSEGQYARLFS